ncbi:hypothetical protein BDY19DRAFT_565903 [Irpex rosettiformis]|uniref:Uncharacterized protein n=1 Tax=Irpex rosettiformis TaxID=378272 RepID=A0ACB8UBW4_9APHY|nr:hypothetical protein BDY19DRAFT_565903 [Irpex rosettiformis]
MNLAYFASQVAGRSKVTAITGSKSPITCSPTSGLSTASAALSAACYHLSPGHFASTDMENRSVRGISQRTLLEAADALIRVFVERATPEVQSRHILDREKVAGDLKRCCMKAAKEYVRKVT